MAELSVWVLLERTTERDEDVLHVYLSEEQARQAEQDYREHPARDFPEGLPHAYRTSGPHTIVDG